MRFNAVSSFSIATLVVSVLISPYQVTLDIALLWSAEIGRITILLT